MRTFLSILIMSCLVLTTSTAQSNSLLYTNVTIHVGNGRVIENGQLGMNKGKIDWVGAQSQQAPKKYQQTIDGKGQHLYPGLIAPNTRLGLEEIQAVRATRDYAEVGRFNPNIRSIIAYNTDSYVTPTIRSNGILLAQIVPEGGRLSGQSSLVYTEADNWEDAAFALDNCVHLSWPSRIIYKGWWASPGGTERNQKYRDGLEAIRVYFDAAKAYAQKEKVERKNIKFETMKALFAKDKKLVVHVNDARAIMDAVKLLQPYGVDIVLQGATEAWQVADFIKENNIPIILGDVQRLPRREDSDIDQPYKTPALLQAKGIPFAFSQSAQGSWNTRNLMFQAGQAVAFGLDKEAALTALTLNTAKILGVDKRVGSLEVGKDATLLVSQGDLLDMRTSVVTAAYMAGKPVDLGNKQKDLNEKYRERYELDK
ncbi:MAG: amidohydrolase family protein [Aureispira sp.]